MGLQDKTRFLIYFKRILSQTSSQICHRKCLPNGVRLSSETLIVASERLKVIICFLFKWQTPKNCMIAMQTIHRQWKGTVMSCADVL